MSTQLNAASRLRTETEVKASPIEESRRHTYMASLYTQMLKSLRKDHPEVKDIKDLFKLTNKQGYRAILVNHAGLRKQGVDIMGEMRALGWDKSKKVGKTVVMYRADGSFPILTGQDTSLNSETHDLWTLAPVDNIKEVTK